MKSELESDKKGTMEYYNYLIGQATAYSKLAKFYKQANNSSWKFFAERSAELTEQANTIKENT